MLSFFFYFELSPYIYGALTPCDNDAVYSDRREEAWSWPGNPSMNDVLT